MKLKYLIAYLILPAILIGCTNLTGGYGGLKRQIRLETKPTEWEVFVIPNTIWVQHGGDVGSINLSDYEHRTPTTVYLDPKEMVMVARDDAGLWHSRRFMPEDGTTETISLPVSKK